MLKSSPKFLLGFNFKKVGEPDAEFQHHPFGFFQSYWKFNVKFYCATRRLLSKNYNYLLVYIFQWSHCPAKAFPPEARNMTDRASYYPGDSSVDWCMDGRNIKSVLKVLLF